MIEWWEENELKTGIQSKYVSDDDKKIQITLFHKVTITNVDV